MRQCKKINQHEDCIVYDEISGDKLVNRSKLLDWVLSMPRYIAVLLLSVTSFCACADTNTPTVTIKSILTGWNAEGIFFNTNEGAIVEGCAWTRLRLHNDNPYFKEILTLGLSAFHAKSKVIFRVSGCTGNDMDIKAIQLIQ